MAKFMGTSESESANVVEDSVRDENLPVADKCGTQHVFA